ncbi:MAG: hypothetical protein K8L91_01485 [Anaerolineae bacterium]|nr:hypothetical protein [Anaerolineae bacterium]
MTDISIAPHLVEKLRRIAEIEHRPVEAVLESLIEQYPLIAPDTEEADSDVPPLGTLARLAYEARKNSFHSGRHDTTARSREILQNEFADYLLRRMDDGA